MLSQRVGPHEVNEEFCRKRQDALREDLRNAGCAAVLVRDRGQLTRLFNYRAREIFPAAAVILADGLSVICRPDGLEGAVFADEERVFEAAFLSSPDCAIWPLRPCWISFRAPANWEVTETCR
jgi:Xaa-Pro dipeptidase